MENLKGYFQGTSWNDNARKFEIKTLGEKSNGAILCGKSVSGKDRDGNKVYGKSIDVKVNIKSEQEGGRVYKLISEGVMCECQGFYVPNNWTNKEGKEVKGVQFLVTDSTTFVEASMDKPAPKQVRPEDAQSEDELPW